VVFEGWNTLFAERDPSGHAEMNALRLAHAVASLPDPRSVPLVALARREGAIHRYEGRGEADRPVLYTTLEPCPMCTVCLINAGVSRVVVGAPDPPSGTLAPSRLARLPSIWPQLAAAAGLDVVFCQSTDAGDPATYLSPGLRRELLECFARSRDHLDASLGFQGVLDFSQASDRALELLRGD
jgi:tRNA(Arg) A34 adenosine deaminase TadA